MINEKLLARVTADAPAGDFYVFAYGSLMWRPGFARESAQTARVFGYHRRLAIFSTHYRGTPSRPGLVLGLDAGGSCCGVLYRVARRRRAAVIRYLFRREMFSAAYAPRYVAAGGKAALTFVARRDGPQYAPPMSDRRAARIIAASAGAGGANAEYIFKTRRRLADLGIASPLLARLCRLLQAGVK